MSSSNRKYLASFIVDNRGKEESVEQIVDGIKKVIAEIKGEVASVDNLGRKDFARVTDRKLTGAHYVQIAFSGPPEAPANLREKLRLNSSVYRTFIKYS